MNEHIKLLIIAFFLSLILGLGKVWMIGFWIVFVIVYIILEFISLVIGAFKGASQLGEALGKWSVEQQKHQYGHQGEPSEDIEWEKEEIKEPSQPPTPTSQSIPELILELASLKDSGIISEEEIEEKKKELQKKM